ncbi:hypothetical protein KXW40_007279, partial [Aspergillus fumigatus]
KCALASVSKNHETFHSIDTAEPGAKTLDGFVVHSTILSERSDRSGGQSTHIKSDHVDEKRANFK